MGDPITKHIERPQRLDPDVLSTAARLALPAVLEWAGPIDQPEEVQGALVEAYRHCGDHGFKLAQFLAGYPYYWECDSRLVDILDCGWLHDAHRDAVKKWAARQTFAYPQIGSTGAFERFGKTETGEVTRIDRERAELVIFSEHLGHVRAGLGTHGSVVAVELFTTQGGAS